MRRVKAIRMFVAAALMAGIMAESTGLRAQDKNLVTVTSKAGFEQTVQSVRKMVAKSQMMVMAEINQGKMLSMTGLKLKAVALFIGNPTVGKKLFTANKGVGVAVPIRVAIFQGDDGKTYVSYVKPSAQLAPFGNKQINMIAKMLDDKLAKLTMMLSK